MSKISEYKNMISLIDYIQYKELPFTVSDKSTRNSLKLYQEIETPEGDIVRGDVLIVSRYKKFGKIYDNYFNTNEDWKGNSYSIIDFVHKYVLGKNEHEKQDFAKIFTELDEYINSPKYVHPENSEITLKTHSKSASENRGLTKSDLENKKMANSISFDYLKSRRIKQSVYNNRFFNSTYCNYIFRSENFSKENPAFIYLNELNKIQTIQQIVETEGEKGLIRQKYFLKDIDKASALWKSNRLHDLNLIILTEAPEKCMAHFQIYEEDMEKNGVVPYYLATGGNVSEEQLKHIEKIAKEYKKDIILSYDNDRPGLFYTVKTLLYFNSPHSELSKENINGEEYYKINLRTKPKYQDKNPDEIKRGNDYEVSLMLSAKSKKDSSFVFEYHNSDEVSYTFPANDKNIDFIKKAFKDIIKEKSNIKVMEQYAITKDWVDDLERIDTLKVKKYEKQNLPKENEKGLGI